LFLNGDPNLRHSIEGMGQFYRIEFIALIFGLVLFFTNFKSHKIKWLITFWIIFGILPSAITRNGGNHATRLILILPPLVILMAFGLVECFSKLKNLRLLFVFGYLIAFGIGFIYYQHNYWVHNPWSSERWWHSGYKEAIQSIKDIDDNYDRVVISMAGEPAWIFFAGWYEYPPDKWHAEFPVGNDIEVEGFGKISHTGKYYFGPVSEAKGIYGLGDIIDNKTLYLAVAKEIGANLIREPERTPGNLELVKAISYPSGEPAYYLFSGLKND